MSVEFIRKADPYVFLSKIEPDATKKREILEHQAGIHLLQEGMSLIGLSFSDYIIMYTEYGKPYFVKKNESQDIWVPNFSISHCKGYVACAISKREIGCDIERIKRVPDILNREINKVSRLVDRQRYDTETSYRTCLWTVYEAIGKCNGRGIPLNKDIYLPEEWKIYTWIINNEVIFSSTNCAY